LGNATVRISLAVTASSDQRHRQYRRKKSGPPEIFYFIVLAAFHIKPLPFSIEDNIVSL
jgi:hypothetical protein